jgi:hypothetical protein
MRAYMRAGWLLDMSGGLQRSKLFNEPGVFAVAFGCLGFN